MDFVSVCFYTLLINLEINSIDHVLNFLFLFRFLKIFQNFFTFIASLTIFLQKKKSGTKLKFCSILIEATTFPYNLQFEWWKTASKYFRNSALNVKKVKREKNACKVWKGFCLLITASPLWHCRLYNFSVKGDFWTVETLLTFTPLHNH